MRELSSKIGVVFSCLGIAAGWSLLLYGYLGHDSVSGMMKAVYVVLIVTTLLAAIGVERLAYKGVPKDELVEMQKGCLPQWLDRSMIAINWFGGLLFIGLLVLTCTELGPRPQDNFPPIAMGGFTMALCANALTHWYALGATADAVQGYRFEAGGLSSRAGIDLTHK